MKTSFKILLLLCLFGFYNCSSWKETLVTQGYEDAAIMNIIEDFVQTEKISNDGAVFIISRYEPGEYDTYVLDTTNCYIFDILQMTSVYYVGDSLDYGISKYYIPKSYVKKKGKCFLWNDSKEVPSPEIVSILKEHNLIDFSPWERCSLSPSGWKMHPIVINESLEGTTYYICKNDLTNYKKVTSRFAVGWYPPPKVECED